MRYLLAATLATLTAAGLAAIRPAVVTDDERAAALAIRENRMRADVRYLSSDLLEGRGPATRGDRLARAFLASRFEAIGLEPGAPGGSWEQPFDLIGVTAACPPVLRASRGDDREDLRFLEDYVAYSGVQADEAVLREAEIVFVGYGIVAPEHQWDDFKGVDLKGRVLLFLNSEPEADPRLFAGKRRLYYGRWDYKHDMAAKRGAAGAIILHSDASAGYGWKVVQASWTGEQLSLPAVPGEPTVAVKGWVTEEAGRRLARLGGRDLDALRAAAETRGFRPLPLGVRVSLALRNDVKRRSSANVVGLLRGRDPELSSEAVVYTAHHDHYGTRPGPSGEPVVYNGALDNASGLASLLAIAEAFAALPARPRRSVLFAAVAAEEHGLLGSDYLAKHPPVPTGRLAANVNIDGVNVWGRTRDVPVVGLGKSSLDDWIRAVAEAQGRVVVPEPFPDEGAYYRSDHLSFARVGVPAAYVDAGTEVIGKPPGWGRARQQEWEAACYHQPGDDLTADWDLSGAVEDARLLFHLGTKVAEAPLAPTWRPGDEFEAARRKALAELGR
ncbi:MAG TPA: M28 family peptidase [Vicinamibacteria bacterium]|nr:M28 family peptidase [Vicinamibacteria bacterium]